MQFMFHVNPLAAPLLEYSLKEFRDVVYSAETLEDWIEKIEETHRHSTPEKELERIAVARESSWDARVKIIRAIIEDRLQRKA